MFSHLVFFPVGVNTSHYHPATSPRAASCLGECAERREREGSFLLCISVANHPLSPRESCALWGEPLHRLLWLLRLQDISLIFSFFVSFPSAWQCLNLISSEVPGWQNKDSYLPCAICQPYTHLFRYRCVAYRNSVNSLAFYCCAFLMSLPSDIVYFKPVQHAV